MSFPRSRIGAVPCRTYGTQEGCPFGNSCTFRHDEETQQQAQERQHAAYMATKNSGGGGGGGGGPVSPTRVARVPVGAPWAPARAQTYAQKAQPKPEMPDWMIEGEELKKKKHFPGIAEAEAAYKRAVETAIAAEKAAEAAAQEAYRAALEKAGGGKMKPREEPADLTVKMNGRWADEADSEEE